MSKEITQLTALTAANIATGDLVIVEDISVDETKKMTYAEARIAMNTDSRVLAAADTAPLPGFSWSGDPNTGMYNVAANQVGLVTDGAIRVLVGVNSGLVSQNWYPNSSAAYDLGDNTLRWKDAYASRFLSANASVGSPGLAFGDDSDTGLFRSAANTIGVACGGAEVVTVGSEGGVKSILNKNKTGDESSSSNIVLQDDDHLTATLLAGATYAFRFVLFTNNVGALEGIRLALGGTATATSIKAQIKIYDDVTTNALAGFGRVTALASAVGAVLPIGDNYAEIDGVIEVNAAGTFLLSWAQQVSGTDATKVLRNSSMVLTKL